MVTISTDRPPYSHKREPPRVCKRSLHTYKGWHVPWAASLTVSDVYDQADLSLVESALGTEVACPPAHVHRGGTLNTHVHRWYIECTCT